MPLYFYIISISIAVLLLLWFELGGRLVSKREFRKQKEYRSRVDKLASQVYLESCSLVLSGVLYLDHDHSSKVAPLSFQDALMISGIYLYCSAIESNYSAKGARDVILRAKELYESDEKFAQIHESLRFRRITDEIIDLERSISESDFGSTYDSFYVVSAYVVRRCAEVRALHLDARFLYGLTKTKRTWFKQDISDMNYSDFKERVFPRLSPFHIMYFNGEIDVPEADLVLK